MLQKSCMLLDSLFPYPVSPSPREFPPVFLYIVYVFILLSFDYNPPIFYVPLITFAVILPVSFLDLILVEKLSSSSSELWFSSAASEDSELSYSSIYNTSYSGLLSLNGLFELSSLGCGTFMVFFMMFKSSFWMTS